MRSDAARAVPDITKLVTIGQSVQGQDIVALKAWPAPTPTRWSLVVVVRNHPRGGGLGKRLAARLDAWAADNPDPYPALHWP